VLSFVSKLQPNDYICFNLGNSSKRLLSDSQAKIKDWRNVTSDNQGLLKDIKNRDSVKIVNEFVNAVEHSGKPPNKNAENVKN
jgi:hypothetical protein